MNGFTSTGMTGLLFRVLERLEPDLVAGVKRPDPMARAVMPDTQKRALIGRALAQCGPGLLLSVGQHLDLADETPVLTVLARSSDPGILAEKFMRLERYNHATHRTRISADAATTWTCRRDGAGAPATQGENCLIAGLLVGLLGLVGMQNCRIGISNIWIDPKDFNDLTLEEDEVLDRFAIRWSADVPTSIRAPRASSDGPINDRLADLLASDIGRGWKLQDAARRLALSRRSLQRHLATEGRSFSSVLRQARMREATALLTHEKTTLAEIGYCCGYADQAHFQRDFLRAVNMTPRGFRSIAMADRPGVIVQ